MGKTTRNRKCLREKEKRPARRAGRFFCFFHFLFFYFALLEILSKALLILLKRAK